MAEYLIDTNLLVSILVKNNPWHSTATESVAILEQQQNHLNIVPQNIIELWNVCTRPANKNGLGLTDNATALAVEDLENRFTLHLDTPEIYSVWKTLVAKYQVRGIQVHDTRLVAACLVHGLSHILTFNVKDFRRFSEITVVNPKQINQNSQ